LHKAIDASRKALVLHRELEDEFMEGVTLHNLGRMLGSKGTDAFARVALRRSRRLFMEQGNGQREGMASAYLGELALQVGDLLRAGTWAKHASELAALQRFERDFIRAALLQGRVALGTGNLLRADEHLHYALTRTRAVNVVEFELPALIAIAELELQRSRLAEAKARLEDVWEAAERGPYPLQQADAFNVLAAIARANSDEPGAIAAATHAFEAAWCDGPPYAYHWGLEKAKAHLAALGAPEPVLPPFDESKFETMPEIEINPEDKYWVDPASLD
jgi:tetratricopeptide (TPR) repeat protein